MKFFLITKLPEEIIKDFMRRTDTTPDELEKALKSQTSPTCAVLPSPDSFFSIVACLDEAKGLTIGSIALPTEEVNLAEMFGDGMDTGKA